MITVGELKRWLNRIRDDDLPVMLEAHYNGFDPLESLPVTDMVAFQGTHAESGEWERFCKLKEDRQHAGAIKAVIIKG